MCISKQTTPNKITTCGDPNTGIRIRAFTYSAPVTSEITNINSKLLFNIYGWHKYITFREENEALLGTEHIYF